MRLVTSLEGFPGKVTAIYARVTQEESVEFSIPNQKARALELAKENEWPWVKLYIEPRNVGGHLWIDDRPALAELIADVEAGRVERVFVRHEDRLWRSTEVQDKLIRIFRKHRVQLWALRGKVDYISPHGKLGSKISAVVAEYEKDITGDRIREMRRQKARRGEQGGGPPPFGYTSQARLKSELISSRGMSEEEAYRMSCETYPVGKAWFVDESEAKIVRQIFGWYLDPAVRWGGKKIADTLNESGTKTRHGKMWEPKSVLRVINNPAVAGMLTYDEESYKLSEPSRECKKTHAIFEAKHPAIVSKEAWHEAQQVKVKNNLDNRERRDSRRSYPLSSAIYCGKCGSPMWGKPASRMRNFAYYVCGKKKRFGQKYCDFPVLPTAEVESKVWKALETSFTDSHFIDSCIEEANQSLKARTPAAARAIAQKEKETARLDRVRTRYMGTYESARSEREAKLAWEGVLSCDERKKKLDAEIVELREKVVDLHVGTITKEWANKYFSHLREVMSENKARLTTLYRMLKDRYGLRIVAQDEQTLRFSVEIPSRVQMNQAAYANASSASLFQGVLRRAGRRP